MVTWGRDPYFENKVSQIARINVSNKYEFIVRVDKGRRHSSLYVSIFRTMDSCALSSSSVPNFQFKAMTNILMSISIFLHRVPMWHIYTRKIHWYKKNHTWGQIHIFFWWEIITPLTDVANLHIRLIPALPYLIWRLN